MKLRISKKDLQILNILLSGQSASDRYKELKQLSAELAKMEVLDDADLPSDLVGLHSKVSILDEDSGRHSIFIITLPSQASIRDGKVSVLAPVGIALLGASGGDLIEWSMPAGVKKIRITGVENSR